MKTVSQIGCSQERKSFVENTQACGEITAFSLTLTLSRWERGQPLNISKIVSTVEQKPTLNLPERWKQFSLSQRERAGVRERLNPRSVGCCWLGLSRSHSMFPTHT